MIEKLSRHNFLELEKEFTVLCEHFQACSFCPLCNDEGCAKIKAMELINTYAIKDN